MKCVIVNFFSFSIVVMIIFCFSIILNTHPCYVKIYWIEFQNNTKNVHMLCLISVKNLLLKTGSCHDLFSTAPKLIKYWVYTFYQTFGVQGSSRGRPLERGVALYRDETSGSNSIKAGNQVLIPPFGETFWKGVLLVSVIRPTLQWRRYFENIWY